MKFHSILGHFLVLLEERRPSLAPAIAQWASLGQIHEGRMGRGGRGDLRGRCHPLPSPEILHPAKERVSGPYVKVITVHSLIVQGDGHPDANVRLPLDGGRGDDEVVRVVPHQVHLEHAVQALDQNGEETSQSGRRG